MRSRIGGRSRQKVMCRLRQRCPYTTPVPPADPLHHSFVAEGPEFRDVATHVAAFDEELTELAGWIAEIGGLAERMLVSAVTALARIDTDLAQTVITDDYRLDTAQRRIEENGVAIIARRQPMARDLREIVAAMRIRAISNGSAIWPRTSPSASSPSTANISRSAWCSASSTSRKSRSSSSSSCWMPIRRAMKSPPSMCASATARSMRFTPRCSAKLLTYMMEDPRNITFCTPPLFCAKNIERIGDHATNIAESIHYLATGEQLGPDRPSTTSSRERRRKAAGVPGGFHPPDRAGVPRTPVRGACAKTRMNEDDIRCPPY